MMMMMGGLLFFLEHSTAFPSPVDFFSGDAPVSTNMRLAHCRYDPPMTARGERAIVHVRAVSASHLALCQPNRFRKEAGGRPSRRSATPPSIINLRADARRQMSPSTFECRALHRTDAASGQPRQRGASAGSR